MHDKFNFASLQKGCLETNAGKFKTKILLEELTSVPEVRFVQLGKNNVTHHMEIWYQVP